MALGVETLKDAQINRVAKVVKSRLSGAKARSADFFIREFYRDVPPQDLLDEDPENLYGAGLSLWQFGAVRKPGRAKVRVYNPEVEEHGWRSSHTIIEIVNDDMPFLVDSVTMELNRRNLQVHLVIHPTFAVQRNGEGKAKTFKSVTDGANGAVHESLMHVRIGEQTSPEALKSIEKGVLKVLNDVRAAVNDWQQMLQQVEQSISELAKAPAGLDREEVDEAIAFLQWAHDDRFTFLGYRQFKLVGRGAKAKVEIVPKSGMGVLRNARVMVFEGLGDAGRLSPAVEAFLREPRPLRVNKANLRSTIHRPVHLDTFGVKQFNAKGQVVGEHLFVGLFTSVAYSQSSRQIPYLRRKVDAVMSMSKIDPGSHLGKALMHILENYPRDELFQVEAKELHDTCRGIANLQERQRTALFVRQDPFERYFSAFVYTPRERYTQAIRHAFGEILCSAFNGHVAAYYTHFTNDILGRINYIVSTKPGQIPDYDIREVEARLQEATRSWGDWLEEALVDKHGEEQGLALLRRYGDAFPTAYRESFAAQAAVLDIARVEEALESGKLVMNLYRPVEAAPNELRFKIYNSENPVQLSDILPVLENLGLTVLSEVPFEVSCAEIDRIVYIQDFGLLKADGEAVDIAAIRGSFHETFARVWDGEMEDDGFNSLVFQSGLSWREVVIVRAYCKFLRQARIPFSQNYMEETLASNGDLARLIVELFHTRFDPDLDNNRERKERSILGRINSLLDDVANLDEDRILRHFVNLVQATLRTNYYQFDEGGGPKTYVSFKLDSKLIDELPQPRPHREIFVYSPRFEGVHLRFGLVARGGLRWSDRREDFRTEVLGLVKAQQVKNGVIVPVGSKGGFVLKKAPPPSDRDGFMAEGVACYKTFIGGLLDITDNLAGEKVLWPERVVRKDGDDPYLVVAADKGTATFSDYANGIARDYGFWLDDAFASGGSVGYDHKKMGITARGAWESVKRHFREMGHNTQTQDFTVVGVGDMSGDVFGNGMLLSRHIKLLGGFNHLHIFVDPDADPAASYAERKRLFGLARSSWIDYDAKLISKGGGVFDRSAKSIDLTPEIKQLFGIAEDRVTPNALLKAMLLAEADLLWFGGIGTYIKSADESHADAGDRANDAIRIDGGELRCKVLGEGANLGVTQLGRIEFALNGGRLNTDFIDNSAGVDCSDHEVNIKIALGDVVQRGKMTVGQRNRLMARMTNEVAELVLRDNYQQSQAITVSEARGHNLFDRQRRFMRALERAGKLDREIEFLPDDEEIDNRLAAKQGLTRPEISVLLSYAKIVAYEELLESDLPDEPLLVEDLMRYFPKPIREGYPGAIKRHRLRREIVATMATNSMINRVGATFITEMQESTGQSTGEIARAYLIARDTFQLRDTWDQIEALDNKIGADIQTEMLQETNRLGQRNILWFLRNGKYPLNITRETELYADHIRELRDGIDDVIGPDDMARLKARAEHFVARKVPAVLAEEIARVNVLSSACDIVRIAVGTKRKVKDVATIYFGLGTRFGIDWLRGIAQTISPENAWQKRALDAVVDDLYSHQSTMTNKVLDVAGRTKDVDKMIDQWVAERGAAGRRAEELIADLRSAGMVDVSMLAVANRELKNLIGE